MGAESDKVGIAIFQLVQKRPIKGVKTGTKYLTIIIRLRARVFYERIVNEAQPS